MIGTPHPVCRVRAILGEGPAWIDGALWFADIKQRRIHRFDPSDGARRCWDAPAQPGWILPFAEGGLLCGLQTGLHRFEPATGRFTHIAEIESDFPGNRLNDATVDVHGRLWFGSMDDAELAASGHVYRADVAGIARVASGIAITNGPAASPDGTLLYHVDTLMRAIFVSRIVDDGALSDTRVFATIDAADGYPDGPVVDDEGCLWIGLWGGWSARRYSPQGELLTTVRFPVANVTKIAFGGTDGRTAYATTAAKGLTEAELAGQPHAGDLFAFALDVAGRPVRAVGAILVERRYA